MTSTKVVSVAASNERLETATKKAVEKLEDALVEYRKESPESSVAGIDHEWSLVTEEAEDGESKLFMVTMVAVLED